MKHAIALALCGGCVLTQAAQTRSTHNLSKKLAELDGIAAFVVGMGCIGTASNVNDPTLSTDKQDENAQGAAVLCATTAVLVGSSLMGFVSPHDPPALPPPPPPAPPRCGDMNHHFVWRGIPADNSCTLATIYGSESLTCIAGGQFYTCIAQGSVDASICTVDCALVQPGIR